MVRGVVPAIGLFLGLLPAVAQAQTNIDQGKSPAEVFANGHRITTTEQLGK